jgi:hypothetical protein
VGEQAQGTDQASRKGKNSVTRAARRRSAGKARQQPGQNGCLPRRGRVI